MMNYSVFFMNDEKNSRISKKELQSSSSLLITHHSSFIIHFLSLSPGLDSDTEKKPGTISRLSQYPQPPSGEIPSTKHQIPNI
jgi:hypothetical protein